MASFGFSLGDIIVVSKLASSVYKSFRGAPNDFKVLKVDAKALRFHLRTHRHESRNHHSLLHQLSDERTRELTMILRNCRHDLDEIRIMLSRYESLGTTGPRKRDRLAFTPNKQAVFRERIATHSQRLQLFISALSIGALGHVEDRVETSLAASERIQAKLEVMHDDMLAGRRNTPNLTNISSWAKQELPDDDISVEDVEVNHEIVSTFLENLRMQNNPGDVLQGLVALEEDSIDEGSAMIPHLDLSYSLANIESGSESETERENSPLPELTPLVLDNTYRNPKAKAKTEGYTQKEPSQDLETTASRANGTASPASTVDGSPKLDSKVTFDEPGFDAVIGTVDRMSSRSVEGEEVNFEVDVLEFWTLKDESFGIGKIAPDVDKIEPTRKAWHIDHAAKQLPCRWRRFPNSTLDEDEYDVPVIEIPLPVTLETILSGADLRVRVKRLGWCTYTNSHFQEEKIEIITINKGKHSDTWFFRPRSGNQFRYGSQDLLFTILQTPHPIFNRGMNPEILVHEIRIALCGAFHGWEHTIDTLDGVALKIECSGPTHPGHVLHIKNFGLPYYGASHKRGPLCVFIRVEIPHSITNQQVSGLKDVLCQTTLKESILEVNLLDDEAYKGPPLDIQHYYAEKMLIHRLNPV